MADNRFSYIVQSSIPFNGLPQPVFFGQDGLPRSVEGAALGDHEPAAPSTVISGPIIKTIWVMGADGTPRPAAYHIGDTVKIDGGNVQGRVIGICAYPHGIEFKVSWWNNGDLRSDWIADFRLEAA